MNNSRVLSWLLLSAYASAQNLCADINTSDSHASPDIYQSAGKCTSTCGGKFAYAVLQSSNCWCSNYTPDEASQKDGCTLNCPGYPSDTCGGKGRYTYLLVNADLISGSKGSESASSSTASTDGTHSTPTSSPDSIPTASNSHGQTTVDGVVQTVTVQPSETAVSDKASSSSDGNHDSGIQVPTLLGIVFGSIGGIAILAIGIIWFFYSRKRNDGDSNMFETVSPMRTEDKSRSSIDNLSDPFSDSRTNGLYSWRNRSGSLEYMPDKESTLRVANPDPM